MANAGLLTRIAPSATGNPCWSVSIPSITDVVCASGLDAKASRNAFAHKTLNKRHQQEILRRPNKFPNRAIHVFIVPPGQPQTALQWDPRSWAADVSSSSG